MSDGAYLHTILKCQRCEQTDEYYIPAENWPDGIECTTCERNGPFQVAKDGVVEFDGIQKGDIELSGFEQVKYRPQTDDYDPPDGHKVMGADEYIVEDGTNGSISDGSVLLEAKDTESLDSEERKNEWNQVMDLFDNTDNGTTTRAYNRAAALLSDIEAFAAIRESDELYYYDDAKGYYVRKGETFIGELLRQYMPGYTNTNRKRNILDAVKDRNYIAVEAFQPPQGKVNVKNGVLDLDTRELEPHSPEYYFTSQLQTEYNPDAQSELWTDFIESSVENLNDRHKIMEFVGYTLETWHHNREKNLFIVGPSQSGKSTFADTIQELFGVAPTVTNLTPQQLADTQFDAASLKEAMVNAVNDINASKIENSGALKRILSGERMKMERKHQDAHFDEPTAKHMYTANWLPRVVGQDESLYRRVLIVEFPNQVPDDERDEHLKQQLQQEEVLSAILNDALDARDRLHEQGGFTADRSREDTRRKWDSWRDAHKRFLYTQFEITGDSDHTVDKEAYYQGYKEYANREGYELRAKQSVTKSLKYTPEVGVTDDYYSGLVWEDRDAADKDTFDVPQSDAIKKVKAAIELRSFGEETADRKEVIAALADNIGPDRVENTIAKLKDQGEVQELEAGGLELTD